MGGQDTIILLNTFPILDLLVNGMNIVYISYFTVISNNNFNRVLIISN